MCTFLGMTLTAPRDFFATVNGDISLQQGLASIAVRVAAIYMAYSGIFACWAAYQATTVFLTLSAFKTFLPGLGLLFFAKEIMDFAPIFLVGDTEHFAFPDNILGCTFQKITNLGENCLGQNVSLERPWRDIGMLGVSLFDIVFLFSEPNKILRIEALMLRSVVVYTGYLGVRFCWTAYRMPVVSSVILAKVVGVVVAMSWFIKECMDWNDSFGDILYADDTEADRTFQIPKNVSGAICSRLLSYFSPEKS